MEVGWYLNHSASPNMARLGNGRWLILKDIEQDEEILVDYNEFNEPEETKETFYKKNS